MAPFFNGILFGLIVTVLIGPVFFSLIQTSIEKGIKSGISMAVGISLSDAVYIFLVYLGVSPYLDDDRFRMALGVAGGLIMFCFGIYSIIKPVPQRVVHQDIKGKNNALKQVAKGFMLNGINPFVLIFWVGMVSMGSVNYEYSTSQIIFFFCGILSTVFTTDIIKAYIAHKLRHIVTERFLRIMNRIVGIALFVFGLKLFHYALV